MIKTDEYAASMRAMRPHDIDRIHQAIDEVEKVIVGQRGLIRKVFIALLADGHVLLEGAPGLAKTLLASAVGSSRFAWTSLNVTRQKTSWRTSSASWRLPMTRNASGLGFGARSLAVIWSQC